MANDYDNDSIAAIRLRDQWCNRCFEADVACPAQRDRRVLLLRVAELEAKQRDALSAMVAPGDDVPQFLRGLKT